MWHLCHSRTRSNVWRKKRCIKTECKVQSHDAGCYLRRCPCLGFSQWPFPSMGQEESERGHNHGSCLYCQIKWHGWISQRRHSSSRPAWDPLLKPDCDFFGGKGCLLFHYFSYVHRTWHSSLHGVGQFSGQSVVSDSFSSLWTVAHQALSMWFSRQEYWSGLPCPPPGDCPSPGTKAASPVSSAVAGGFFTTESPARARAVTHQLTRHIAVSYALFLPPHFLSSLSSTFIMQVLVM